MTNLAGVLRGQGKFDEARKLHEQTLEIRRRILGPEHPDTLWSMNNLAIVLGEQGKHDEARKLLEQTLEIRRRILGPEHPDTLESMHNLASRAHSCRARRTRPASCMSRRWRSNAASWARSIPTRWGR